MDDRTLLERAARAPFRTLQASPQLRWEQRSVGCIGADGTYLPPYTVLQQAWVCQEDGSVEWRDVPTVFARTASLAEGEAK